MAAGDLLNRLSHTVEPSLPAHQFWASLVEWVDGVITRADIITTFNIQVEEESDLDWIKGKIDAATNKKLFLAHLHGLFILAQVSLYNYQNKAIMQARINGLSY